MEVTVAHHKSAIKRIRTNDQRRLRNKHFRSALRTDLKKFDALLSGDNKEEAAAGLPKIMSRLGKSVVKGVINKAAAGRKISRLSKALNKVNAAV
jgi:small subunit ribosomal protein S20